MTNCLRGLRGEVIILMVEVYLLPEEEAEKDTNIRGNTMKEGQGDSMERHTIQMVVNIAGILETEKPDVCRGTSAVHNPVGSILNGLVAPLSKVLLLLKPFIEILKIK